MHRARVGEVELEYERVGRSGIPILLIHGANVAREFEPLTRIPGLTERCELIRYHRRGYLGSTPLRKPTSIAQQAADARGLLDDLDLASAHIVGHSMGGAIALELAATAPERARSLMLLEPILRDVPSGPDFFERLAPVAQAYAEGRREDAARGVFEFIGGPGWRDLLVDDHYEDAVEAAPTFFEFERLALRDWSFGSERAAAIDCAVLSVLGTASGSFFEEGRALIHSWFPHCVDADLVGVTHFLEAQDPEGVAEAIESFVPAAEADFVASRGV